MGFLGRSLVLALLTIPSLSFANRIVTLVDLNSQYQHSLDNLMKNLNHADIRPGAVIASPSKNDPNYFYHWTRDAATTHDALFQVYSDTNDPTIFALFKEWVNFEALTQKNSIGTEGGFGEPKFNVDGSAFTGPWGRPQNDGPALRAATMSKWALLLINRGEKSWVRKNLYSSDFPANKIIKKDLEYVALNWRIDNFDLWEEVKGFHFYTLSIQRKALLVGAQLASRMNDKYAAEYYQQQASYIEQELTKFLDSKRGYIVATINQTDGWTHKTSQLDVAILLGLIHGYWDADFVKKHYSWIENTALALEREFKQIYSINKKADTAAIGRYPEDVYDGNGFSGGNPWFIATHAYAEFFCRYAKDAENKSRSRGINYLLRSIQHVDQETNEMAEQYSRFNGYMMGARHLSWSYASYLTAYLACFK